MDIGNQLKQNREQKGLSLREVGEISGLSASFIGQVERNETSPSMRSLKSITDALGVKLADLLISMEPQQETPSHVVSINKRRKVENLFPGVEMYYLTPKDKKDFMVAILYAKPGSSSGDDDSIHEGEEFGYIISGMLRFWEDGKEYMLREGDSISLSSSVPHRWENGSAAPCISLWMTTPPAF
ncbi:cupin domain-containing protein [Fusibacter paucivorans]|uniref:Cupin domain-containing protein n=1 Tax=Fusibacter paucivorans TaxID=76009 RepID=A0ABS5PS30_9FIRM|nr:XRE family transcriptional regulator [Fusibacter paucivorans]MBS7527677.1 cupin domain-containing protein [Fusibacter paucivorans]